MPASLKLRPKSSTAEKGSNHNFSLRYTFFSLAAQLELVAQALPTAQVQALGDLPLGQRRLAPKPRRQLRLRSISVFSLIMRGQVAGFFPA